MTEESVASDSPARKSVSEERKSPPKSRDEKAIDSLEPDERGEVEKLVGDHYKRTLDSFGKKLIENDSKLNSLQRARAEKDASDRPPAKKTNQQLRTDLGRLEAELQDLRDSLAELGAEVQGIEDRYNEKEAAKERRRARRSGRSTPMQSKA
jgi:septal ring factor EnvC (AmiA/AmiB activator)